MLSYLYYTELERVANRPRAAKLQGQLLAPLIGVIISACSVHLIRDNQRQAKARGRMVSLHPHLRNPL